MRCIVFIGVLLIVLPSCKKPEKVSEIPAIKFIGLPVKDTLDELGNTIRRAKLIFSLIDGDGDIGLKENDTMPPYDQGSKYYYNLYVDLYVKHNGQLVPLPLTTPFYYRTKYIEPQGINKVLRCTLMVDMTFNLPMTFDSCDVVFYMYDRSLHQSNVERSGFRRIAP